MTSTTFFIEQKVENLPILLIIVASSWLCSLVIKGIVGDINLKPEIPNVKEVIKSVHEYSDHFKLIPNTEELPKIDKVIKTILENPEILKIPIIPHNPEEVTYIFDGLTCGNYLDLFFKMFYMYALIKTILEIPEILKIPVIPHNPEEVTYLFDRLTGWKGYVDLLIKMCYMYISAEVYWQIGYEALFGNMTLLSTYAPNLFSAIFMMLFLLFSFLSYMGSFCVVLSSFFGVNLLLDFLRCFMDILLFILRRFIFPEI